MKQMLSDRSCWNCINFNFLGGKDVIVVACDKHALPESIKKNDLDKKIATECKFFLKF